MKRTKLLALVLAVSLMLMGAGYAAWNDAVTINNTVTTGYLDVELLSTGSVAVNDTLTNRTAAYSIAKDSQNENDIANVTITNLYPGAVATVTIPVKNIGTIPVKVDSVVNVSPLANYTVTPLSYPGNLGLDGVGNIVYTITVGEDAPEVTTVNFSASVTYTQFNK